MGQDGSKPGTPSQSPSLSNPGYTSFSVSKDSTQKSIPEESKDKIVESPNLPPKENDIVMIHKFEKEVEKDDILDTLSRLPKFLPILKPTETSLLNLFKTEEKIQLEKIDEQLLFDLLSQFQTEMIQRNSHLAGRQQLVFKKITTCNLQSILTLQKVQDKSVTFQNVSHGLRESEKINRFIEQSSRNIEAILKQCVELEELLPHDVISKLDSPLIRGGHPDHLSSN